MVEGNGIEVLISAGIAMFIAQAFKVVTHYIFHKTLNYKLMVETGGMPSSHSAFMMAMAISVGELKGYESVMFAVALSVAVVVMYDAAGVRRAAGRMAGILNQISEDFYTHHPEKLPERLRELLGHTPTEVVVGGILGAVTAIITLRVI
ncbi:MAG: divergent PAP2 family protein [Vampirovibrio sp.]|nr:divergent PAP2 family protein [Vampirovibrio sp.]